MWPYSVWCVCFSACVTAPGLWTALQGLEYGSSPHQQALTEAVRRCVFICVCVCVCLSACHLSCVFMCIIYVSSECILVCLLHFFFLFSSLCSTYRLVKAVCITPLFRYSLNIDNDMCGWPACPLSQSVWCFRWSLCLFPLCRRLSEEAPGGRRVRWQRLHQKDERWLWPSTHLFQRITVCSDDLNPPPLPLLTYETLQRSSEGVRIQKIKADRAASGNLDVEENTKFIHGKVAVILSVRLWLLALPTEFSVSCPPENPRSTLLYEQQSVGNWTLVQCKQTKVE